MSHRISPTKKHLSLTKTKHQHFAEVSQFCEKVPGPTG